MVFRSDEELDRLIDDHALGTGLWVAIHATILFLLVMLWMAQ